MASSGEGVRVAVVDSGIDAGHPDLQGKVAAEAGVLVTMEQSGEVVVIRPCTRTRSVTGLPARA